jgi:hypothetical protein
MFWKNIARDQSLIRIHDSTHNKSGKKVDIQCLHELLLPRGKLSFLQSLRRKDIHHILLKKIPRPLAAGYLIFALQGGGGCFPSAGFSPSIPFPD